MGELKRLLRYLGPYRKDLLIGALLVVVETCFELVIPVLMADLIDVGVANQDIDYVLHKGCLLYTSVPRLWNFSS